MDMGITMLTQEIIHFINKFILKNGEQLEIPAISKEEPFIDLRIIKQTERTYRVTGLLTIAVNYQEKEPGMIEEELLKRRITPRTKLQLEDHDRKTIRWFEQGWIIKEIRFKKDGKTPDSQNYRMGYRMYQYQQKLLQQKEVQMEKEFTKWKNDIQKIMQAKTHFNSEQRSEGVEHVLQHIHSIFHQKEFPFQESPYFPTSWSVAKKLKFLHFVAAFLQLCFQKTEFDWKEIGAAYYKEIGGSKAFDSNKIEFIDQLEEWAGCPVPLLGMTSLGKITPLYFSGQLSGRYSSYQYGPVHALTDLAISEDEYLTRASTLWLVENRAVLTRMAAAENFLKETKSLILCIDGHLRSSHKKCVNQLLLNSNIEQVMIWSDYDPDGFQIAKEIFLAVSESYSGIVKWITHKKEVIIDWKEYEFYMEQLLQYGKMEQEEVLGGEVEWKRWIQH